MGTLLAAAFSTLSAQDFGSAVVVYAEGDGFTIVRNKDPQFYEIDYDPVMGMELQSGDLIQTENGTFLEIQLMESRSILKIAENTNFRLERVTSGGGGSFDIAYGRVRAKVNRLVQGNDFSIRGGSTVAGVRGTDFGYDRIYQVEDGARLTKTRVYCFEGSVAVSQVPQAEEAENPDDSAPSEENASPEGGAPDAAFSDEETPPAEEILITANEMVELDEITPDDAEGEAEPEPVMEKKAIHRDIRTFWEKEKPFMALDSLVSAEEEGEETLTMQEGAKPRVQEPPKKGNLAVGISSGVMLVGGAFVSSLGGAMAINGGDTMTAALLGGGGVLLIGGGVILFSVAY